MPSNSVPPGFLPSQTVSAPASRRPYARRLFTFGPIAAVALGMGVIGARARVPDNQIAPGVHVANLDLSGKTAEAARTDLQTWAKAQQAVTVRMAFPEECRVRKIWKQAAYKIGLSLDVPATLDAAMKAGRSGIIGQVGQMVTGPKTTTLAPVPAVNNEMLRGYMKQVAYKVNRTGTNARLRILAGGGFGYNGDKPGLAVDVDTSAQSVAAAWSKRFTGTDTLPASTSPAPSAAPGRTAPAGNTTPIPDSGEANVQHQKPDANGATPSPTKAPALPDTNADKSADISTTTTPVPAPTAEPLDVTLTAKTKSAAVTLADLKQIDGTLGTYSTNVKGTSNRLNNVSIAASHINGKLLKPGEVFSYNGTVGQRSADNGFRKAHQIVHGRLVDAIGGGICQVSSTLYNTALKSGLRIVERENHAFPIGYVPNGRDATVDWGNIDFRFQNNTAAPLYITGAYGGHRLTFHIYGKRTPGREVEIVKEQERHGTCGTVTQSDPTLPAGRRVITEKGHPPISVTWVRIIKDNGQEVKRETIHSYYKSIPAIVSVGTRRVAPKAPRATSPSAASPAPAALPADTNG